MMAERDKDRTVLAIGGADRADFLQGLVSNDIARLADGLVYAALLTPQGKYLADFFLLRGEDAILVDVQADFAPALAQRLSMYKLRADVHITQTEMPVFRGLGDAPAGAHADPRHETLGWRFYGPLQAKPGTFDWDALRVAACIPETGIELLANDTFPLEAGFERLHGVDFKKGCYVGQEVTARMKHKTELRKGLTRVRISGAAPVGCEIIANGKPAGRLFTQSGGAAIAYLRFDRAGAGMSAGDARIDWPA